jgi:uncharacterized protein (TIGR02246 family)
MPMPANTPEECDALFEKYVNSGDIDALVDLYEPDATLISAPGSVATGHDQIRTALSGLLAANAQLKLNVTQTIVSGDIAATYNEWSGTMSPGGQTMDIKGKAIEICHRQPDGTWRFAIDDPYARD